MYDQQQQIDFIAKVLTHVKGEEVNVAFSGKKDNRVMVSCILAGERHLKGTDRRPSMGIFLDDTGITCYCYSCHWWGSLGDTLAELWQKTGDAETQALAIEAFKFKISEQVAIANKMKSSVAAWGTRPKIDYFTKFGMPEEALRRFSPCENFKECSDYLVSRQVDKSLALRYNLCYHPYERRVCFPVRDLSGKLLEVVGRSLSGSFPRYKHYFGQADHILGGLPELRGQTKVVLVEGYFDLLRCAHYLLPHIVPLCVFTSDLTIQHLKLLKSNSPFIYIMFDNEEEAQRSAYNAKKLCEQAGFLSRVIKPISKDPGESTKQHFETLFPEIFS